MKVLTFAFLALVMFAFQNCDDFGRPEHIAPQSSLYTVDETVEAEAIAVLSTYCGQCHGEYSAGDGGISYIEYPDALIQNNFIVIGNAGSSILYQEIQTGEMPPEEAPQLSDAEKTIVENWINQME